MRKKSAQEKSPISSDVMDETQPPDFAMRLAILKAKTEQLGVKIPPDTLEFMSHRLLRNEKELEGSLNRVIAYAKLIRALPTPEVAARALEDIASKQPRAIFMVDAKGRITLVSEEGCEILGYREEELLGKDWFDAVVSRRMRVEAKDAFRKLITGGIEAGEYHEYPLLSRDGEERLVAFRSAVVRHPNGRVAGALLSGEDITALLKAQERQRHTDLQTSLGEMSAGIAHEVNNPLGSVLLYSELLLADKPAPRTRKDLKVIRDEAKRAAEVVNGLVACNQGIRSQRRLLDLPKFLVRVLDKRRYQKNGRQITLSMNLLANTLYIMGNSAQLRQVFRDIMRNAEEAIERAGKSGGGHIVITMQREKGWAKVSIADDGTGIPEADLKRIFYPFVTVKRGSKSAGLGLSRCCGIITGHNGLIGAENNEMGGATFTVELPLAETGRQTVSSRKQEIAGGKLAATN